MTLDNKKSSSMRVEHQVTVCKRPILIQMCVSVGKYTSTTLY